MDFFRRAGLIIHGPPFPFSGSVKFLAAARPDSTHALVAISLSTASLTFRREGEGHRADYRVTLTLRRADAIAARIEATEPVRVPTIRETQRPDESVLFQQLLTVPPGDYTLVVELRDESTGRSGSSEAAVRVPAFTNGSIAPPLAFYEVMPRISRDSLPLVIANPRSVATFGRDSSIAVYLETYGDAGSTLGVGVLVDNVMVVSETQTLHAGAGGLSTGVARLPLSKIGVGLARVAAWRPGQTDTVSVPIFVGFGEGIPVAAYSDMLAYLRYFVSGTRLRELQNAAPASRGAVWTALYRETDATPSTPENEALQNYFGRILFANDRFAEGSTPGWRTDRGMVLLLLGAPDGSSEPPPLTDPTQRNRPLVWEYRGLGLSVEFFRGPGPNQWKLAPGAENDVWAAARRLTGITQ